MLCLLKEKGRRDVAGVISGLDGGSDGYGTDVRAAG